MTSNICRVSSISCLLLPPAAQTKPLRRLRLLLPPVAGCDTAEASPPPTTPTTGQAIPLLTHTPCYFAATAASHRSRTSEPSYSSTRGHPLPRLPRIRVVPFLGLAVVHRRGALRAAWSTWSRNDFHHKSTVRGEDDIRDPPASWQYASKCLCITSPKIWFLLMVGHLGLTPLST